MAPRLSPTTNPIAFRDRAAAPSRAVAALCGAIALGSPIALAAMDLPRPELPDLDARADLRDRPAAAPLGLTPLAPTPLAPEFASREWDTDLAPTRLLAPGAQARGGASELAGRSDGLETPAALQRRIAADFALAESLRLSLGGVGLDPSRPDALGRGTLALRDGASAAQRRLNLVDVALAWDARSPEPDSPFTFSLLGGVRALHHGVADPAQAHDDPSSIGFDSRSEGGLAAAPLAGLRLRWDLPGGVFVRSGAAWSVSTEPDPRDLSLSADVGYALSRRVDVSVGYERTRATFSADSFDAGIRQDFLFARVSLRF